MSFHNHSLEDILNYNMTLEEAKAFKIALLWEELCVQEFPNERAVRLKKGDPRKSTLFKYCYKLQRETKTLVPDPQYRLYILAQLQIMKNIKSGGVHALIEPQILVGDKAWKRWKMWKRVYEEKIAKHKSSEDIGVKATESKVKLSLRNTKTFLEKEYGRLPTLEEVRRSINDLTMVRWLTLGKVSPYFALLSTKIEKALDGETLEKAFLFDLSMYRSAITPGVEEFFKSIFDS